jgi:hypothetical protein
MKGKDNHKERGESHEKEEIREKQRGTVHVIKGIFG